MDNPSSDGACEVTITAPDRDWLQVLVRQLVEDRLAAAGHVDLMQTTYRWNGEVHVALEARARLHTMDRCVRDVARRVQSSHPYEVACVAASPFSNGSPDYLSWIADECI